MADVSLQGMDELLTQLQAMGNKAVKVENLALKSGANILKDEISKNAPRSNLNKNHLADNISVSSIKNRDGIKYIEVGPQKDFFYGNFLEWGTSKMSAKPFMGPAVNEKAEEIITAMKAVVREALKL